MASIDGFPAWEIKQATESAFHMAERYHQDETCSRDVECKKCYNLSVLAKLYPDIDGRADWYRNLW